MRGATEKGQKRRVRISAWVMKPSVGPSVGQSKPYLYL